MGVLYFHQEDILTANGVLLLGTLETGELAKDAIGRNQYMRTRQVYYDIHNEATTDQPTVQSNVGAKSQPMEAIGYTGAFTLDTDFRHDIRLVGKILSLLLTTYDKVSVSDFAIIVEPSGGRS